MNFTLNDYHRNVSNEELLSDILRVAQLLNQDSLTRDEYIKNNGKFHYSTIEKRFGGWVKALNLCGLSVKNNQLCNQDISHNHKRKNIPDSEILDDIKNVSIALNKKTFSSNEYDQNGCFSRCLVSRRFKTWNNALSAAGLVPYEVQSGVRVDEYNLLKEIERIWVSLGRQPTTTDIKNGISKYSLHTYERRFGSWRKALEFFVSYMNGDCEIEKPDSIDAPEQLTHLTDGIITADKTVIAHKTTRNIGLRTRFLVMKRDNFKCCFCGRSPSNTPGLELHVDHIQPWSKGGETVIDNLQTLCSDCNLGKGNLSEDR